MPANGRRDLIRRLKVIRLFILHFRLVSQYFLSSYIHARCSTAVTALDQHCSVNIWQDALGWQRLRVLQRLRWVHCPSPGDRYTNTAHWRNGKWHKGKGNEQPHCNFVKHRIPGARNTQEQYWWNNLNEKHQPDAVNKYIFHLCSVSTCFGQHIAHHQEINKMYKSAYGVRP